MRFWRRRRDSPEPASDTPSAPVAPGGVPREILRQVRLIELRTRGWVNALFSGEYHSVFKGQGMEFAEVREYAPGDDVRNIDWNVTARMAHPYVKRYVEERELTVLLAVDLSGSEQFGTRGRFKAELAAEIAAVLALSAVRNNDRVGLLVFTDHVEHVVPPRKGRRHVLRLIRDVLAFQPTGRGTDVATALDYAARMLPHRSIIFLLSDFLIPELELGEEALARSAEPVAASPVAASAADRRRSAIGDRRSAAGAPGFRRTLRLVSKRHDLIGIRIVDAAEEELPDAGLLVLTDPETGEEVAVDTSSEQLRGRYGRRVSGEESALRSIFRRLAIDEIEVRTDRSYIGPLMQFFKAREKKLWR